jgi:signal peptidase II
VIGGRALRLGWALASVAVLALDQTTKHLVRACMPLHDSIPILPGLFQLTHVTNRGALFGMMRDLPDPWRAAVFTSIPILAIVLIVWFQARTPAGEGLAQVGLALVLAGAVGNLVDRLRFGQVTDFLDVYLGEHHWPAFNLADASICVGVTLLLLDLMRHGPRPAADHPATDPTHAPRPL